MLLCQTVLLYFLFQSSVTYIKCNISMQTQNVIHFNSISGMVQVYYFLKPITMCLRYLILFQSRFKTTKKHCVTPYLAHCSRRRNEQNVLSIPIFFFQPTTPTHSVSFPYRYITYDVYWILMVMSELFSPSYHLAIGCVTLTVLKHSLCLVLPNCNMQSQHFSHHTTHSERRHLWLWWHF